MVLRLGQGNMEITRAWSIFQGQKVTKSQKMRDRGMWTWRERKKRELS